VFARATWGGATWSDATPTARWKTRAQALGWGIAIGTEVALPQLGANEVGAMSICGVITTRDVLRHGPTIVREFGAAVYIKCCVAILLRRRTTFLNCVCVFEPE
jgi:hypothetical protein